MPEEALFAAGKRCPDCRAVKPLEDFLRNKSTKDGRAVYCKVCHNARGKESKMRLYGGTRHYHLKRRYGIGADEVQALIAQQGGLCAICRAKPAEHVDHSHLTGRVRGILCFGCNGGLGQFQDNTDWLAAAIEYVMRNRDEPDGVRDVSVAYIIRGA